VSSGDEVIARMAPEKRKYVVSGRTTTEAAIRTRPLGDLFAVIGDPQENGGFVTRLYFKPVVAWIWMGTFLMGLGGIVSLTDRRLRIGVPQRSRRQRGGAAAPPSAAPAGPER
jgi:cytochrome c-type biogenesis protein CcmF